ncbi:MAG: helix-turn-helix domain-containing protein [Pseudomonadota bacterium]
MTPNSAKTRHVAFVIYPDIVLLDLVGPLQVFSHALDPETGAPGYTCHVVSAAGAMIQTNTVLPIPSQPIESVADLNIHTVVIVGGDGANTAMLDYGLIAQIRMLTRHAHRVASVCSGALVMAATGLLDGRRAVTHWDDCETLAKCFPKVRVEMDPIYIKDGHVWTSAGITAGIDMALAIVAEDLGRAAAFGMARSMVTQMVRSGGQSQFSPVLSRQWRDSAGQFEALHAWISDNLTSAMPVETLAAQIGMSPRNFARVYKASMGVTPAKAVEAIRTETAQTLLETTDLSIKAISARCGFNDEDRMRRAFLRQVNVSPSEYRNNFQAPYASEGLRTN